MWCWAILLPTPRDPECRNSQTRCCSSTVISMKWLPEPERTQLEAPAARERAGSVAAAASSSATRAVAVSVSAALSSGGQRDGARSTCVTRERLGRPAMSAARELSADGDHAAANVDANRRGNDRAERRNDRTNGRALPRWASGMSATCGNTNGMLAVRRACSRDCGSKIEAQLIRRLPTCSRMTNILHQISKRKHGRVLGRSAQQESNLHSRLRRPVSYPLDHRRVLTAESSELEF